jgi:eukaryotic-like serine/threonine-protein kinase
MALASGTRLGPYEIQSPIGAGGMGEVYRARDTRLDRDVAIKILPESLARDAERMRRFEQEARAVAALSHANIVAVYDTGTHEGVPYLVSELLDGETLRERLKSGPINPRKCVEYALQIGDGLAAAHAKGIVHRDLKPENVFLTTGGRVKLIDFGLAKLDRADDSATANFSAAQFNTAEGVVMGTAAYMSPEQVRGQAVDSRSDIFSFGAVLFEMLTGNRAFAGQSSIETMNAILKEDPPDLDVSRLKIAPDLERVLRHCLEKNPADRFQSARDLAFALSSSSGSQSTAVVRAATRRSLPSWIPWTVAGVLVLIAAAAWIARGSHPSSRGERMEFAIAMKDETGNLAISADGRRLVYAVPDEASGANILKVQAIGSDAVTTLAGTEGATYPFFSPDAAFVGFYADGKLKKVSASGGSIQVLANASSGRGATWGRSGVIVYAPDAGGALWRINANGTDAAALTAAQFVKGEASHRWPFFLPDGEHFLFWAGQFVNSPDDHISGIYLGSLKGGEKNFVTRSLSNPCYANGHLFYMSDQRTLVSVPMELSKGQVTGEPHVVGEGVTFQPSTYWGSFTISENGTLVYSTATGSTLSALTWFDRTGKTLGRVGDVGVYANPSLSPDGKLLAADVSDVKANNVDIWVADLQKGTSARFTFDPAEDVAATWSPDGSAIAYRSAIVGITLHIKNVRGLDPAKILLQRQGQDDIVPNSWTRDGQVIGTLQLAAGGADLILMPVTGGKEIPFLSTRASEVDGMISPDNKWVAYASNESGDWEVYVTSYPSAAGKWQISRGGGNEPRWRGDGKELYYVAPGGVLTAVPVNGEGTFSSATPVPLFQEHARGVISSTDLFTYDVTKDGSRFIVNRFVRPDHAAPLTIILNATNDTKN